MLGWKGKVLRVDLDSGSLSEEKIKKDAFRRCVGGIGIATEFLFKEVRTPIDPLSGDNKIFIFTGPLTGTPVVSWKILSYHDIAFDKLFPTITLRGPFWA